MRGSTLSFIIVCTAAIVSLLSFQLSHRIFYKTLEDWLVLPSFTFSSQATANAASISSNLSDRGSTVVTARGVWASNSELLAQLQTGEIVCQRDAGICTEDGVGFMYSYGKYSFWPQHYNYHIDLWSSTKIIARDLLVSACMTTMLIVDQTLKSVRKIIDTNPEYNSACSRKPYHIEMELSGGAL